LNIRWPANPRFHRGLLPSPPPALNAQTDFEDTAPAKLFSRQLKVFNRRTQSRHKIRLGQKSRHPQPADVRPAACRISEREPASSRISKFNFQLV
jgi:hypothetical protein